jgi:hypothetical protein
MYSDITFSVLPDVDLAGERSRPRSEMAVRGLDIHIPGITSSWRGGSGAADVARCNARVLLLVLIGEGDWGS